MVGFSIAPPCSHITDMNAMGKIREPLNDWFPALSYIADVAEKPAHYLREWREFVKMPGRDDPGMTQEELAEAIGTSKSTISDLERGRLRLSDKWLRKIAPVLKTT